MSSEQQKSKGRSARFTKVGERMDEAFHRTSGRVEDECERLVAYLNNEVIPAVRQRSSRGLRLAAEKLSQFAEYLESRRQS